MSARGVAQCVSQLSSASSGSDPSARDKGSRDFLIQGGKHANKEQTLKEGNADSTPRSLVRHTTSLKYVANA